MANTITWLLIANASHARLFATHHAKLLSEPENASNLALISKFTHEESRKKVSELVSDKMGRYGSTSFAETTDPKAHEAEVFAHQLLEQLDAGRKQNHFCGLILIAPPHFMGLLDRHMSHELKKLTTKRIEKDYTAHDERKILQDLLPFL